MLLSLKVEQPVLALEFALGIVTLLGAGGAVARHGFKLAMKIQLTLDEVRDGQKSAQTHLQALRQNSDRSGNQIRDIENYLEKRGPFRRRDYGPPA